jgi:hypothetical protein
MAIANDLVGVVCQLSQMASSFTSNFTRGQKTDFCVLSLGTFIIDAAKPQQHPGFRPSALSPLSLSLG